MMVKKDFLAAEQTGGAGADAADDGQVGMMEDGQLDGQTAPNAERNQTQWRHQAFRQEIMTVEQTKGEGNHFSLDQEVNMYNRKQVVRTNGPEEHQNQHLG